MKKIVFASASALVALMVPATASAQNFQGPFVGAQAGWNHNKLESTKWGDSELEVGKSKDSVVGGLYVGYDHVVAPNVVLGVEAGISATTKDKITRSESGAFLEVDPKYSIDATARAGYLIDPSTLLYARGGYAHLRTDTRLTGKDGTLRHKDNVSGWTAGGGLERVLTANVSGRVEYRFSKFDEQGSNLDRHQVLLGASFRF
jgi:outer membrane immunogenic protein